MDNWMAMGTACCASSRSTSPEKVRLHRMQKKPPPPLLVTASPYGSKYSALNGIAIEDSTHGIQTGPIKADSKPRDFRSNFKEVAEMEQSAEVLAEVLTGKEGNIGNEYGEKEKGFPISPFHPSPQGSHGVFPEVTAPRHTQLVYSTL